jgi:hypothetical protein
MRLVPLLKQAHSLLVELTSYLLGPFSQLPPVGQNRLYAQMDPDTEKAEAFRDLHRKGWNSYQSKRHIVAVVVRENGRAIYCDCPPIGS